MIEFKAWICIRNLRELMCHFNICLDIHKGWGIVNDLKAWVDYLFTNLDGGHVEVGIRAAATEDEVLAWMTECDPGDDTLEEDTGVYNRGDIFKSFHHQAVIPPSGNTYSFTYSNFMDFFFHFCFLYFFSFPTLDSHFQPQLIILHLHHLFLTQYLIQSYPLDGFCHLVLIFQGLGNSTQQPSC